MADHPALTVPAATASTLTLPDLQALLQSELIAAWVRDLALQVTALDANEITLAMPITARLVHGGGVVCGQSLMAAADTAMVLAISAQLGAFRPMSTVQLQTSFLRPVPGTDAQARIVARVLRRGKSLVFGEIEIADSAGRLCAHSTTTYALL